MDSVQKLLGFFLLMWITASAKARSTSNEGLSSNVVGVASQVITNALLQGQAESSTNYVFSPLGYATILSILGHGSVGQTRKEIFDVLQQPENIDEVRKSFKQALTEYSGNDSSVAPQFKTWFYIYRNNTAEEDFKKILLEDYLVEIKEIEKFDYDFDSSRMAAEKTEAESPVNSKDVAQFEDLKNTEPMDEAGNIEGFETLKLVEEPASSVEQAIVEYDQLNESEKKKVSKFDKHVEESQYIEAPEIKKEIKDVKKASTEKEALKKKLHKESEGPEKVSLPLKKYFDDSSDVHEDKLFESRFGRAQPLHKLGDVASALSGNSIVGRNGGSEAEKKLESKMLLFNGLYFRGSWAQPFSELRSDEKKTFNALTGAQSVKFMSTQGSFNFADIRSRNIVAIELPYKNERYSMIIVMPDTESDLKEFSRSSDFSSMQDIIGRLEPTDMKICVPKFRFECTSRAEKALGKLGITTLFTSKADLRGISKDAEGFQIEELVQHVAIRLDEGSSSENSISAGNIESRNNEIASKVLRVDRPFVFYVRDKVDEIILAVGKIVEIPEEIEVSITFQ